MIMQSDAMSSIKDKFKNLMSPDEKESENNDFYRTFADEHTAATLPPGRRQSMNYSNKRVTPFYVD